MIAQSRLFLHVVHAMIGKDQDQRALRELHEYLGYGAVYCTQRSGFLGAAEPVGMACVVDAVEMHEEKLGHAGCQHF